MYHFWGLLDKAKQSKAKKGENKGDEEERQTLRTGNILQVKTLVLFRPASGHHILKKVDEFRYCTVGDLRGLYDKYKESFKSFLI